MSCIVCTACRRASALRCVFVRVSAVSRVGCCVRACNLMLASAPPATAFLNLRRWLLAITRVHHVTRLGKSRAGCARLHDPLRSHRHT